MTFFDRYCVKRKSKVAIGISFSMNIIAVAGKVTLMRPVCTMSYKLLIELQIMFREPKVTTLASTFPPIIEVVAI